VTPQEQQLLKQLTDRINQTQLQEKDPDAENMLGHELGANPDALYILAQTVLVQNIALDQAKGQVEQLRQQVQQARQQPAHATSFLGRLLGEKDPQPAPPPSQQQQWGGQQPPAYQPVQQYAPQAQPAYVPAPQYQQPQYVPAGSGQPSFLRGAMQTAAGVAAGALVFEGVESVLHGLGGGGGYGMGGYGMGMGGGFGRPGEETVINNYYDQPGTQGFDHDRPEGEHHHDAAQFSDAGYNASGSDAGFNDDRGSGDSDNATNFDDTSSNDASGFDNGGSDDGGSGFDDGGGSDSGGGFDGGGGDLG
jgi:hypothetical protein